MFIWRLPHCRKNDDCQQRRNKSQPHCHKRQERGYRSLIFNRYKTIKVRYGISFIDEKQAKANLQREIKDYDVENQMNIAKNIWNQTLNKIKVEGIDENAKAIFYTSLYRTYERMICLSEDNRYYSAFDNSIHKDSVPFYTDDWIWDTYRSSPPLTCYHRTTNGS